MDKKILGNNLKVLRLEQNLIRSKVSEMTKIPKETIKKIEEGAMHTSFKNVLLLCNAYEYRKSFRYLYDEGG